MKIKCLACLAGVLLSIAGTADAQDRTRIDIDSTKLDDRALIEQLDKAITVAPAKPSSPTVAPALSPSAPPSSTSAPSAPAPTSTAATTPPAAMPAPVSLMMRIEFTFASANLTPNATGTLNRVANILNDPKLQARRFLIEGHTDAVGSDEKNLKLSQQRAMSVMAYLQQRGIKPERLSATGFGKAHLLPDVAPNDGRNRRVEIVPLQ